MALHEMSQVSIAQLLEEQRIVRVCFRAADELYLIPFGFVKIDDYLCGVTGRGRKTEMAARGNSVAFQIDDSDRTGPWGWRSVTGEGVFEVIDQPQQTSQLISVVLSRFTDAPSWFQAEEAARAEAGELLVWRIRVRNVAGRENRPS
jgi:nitroimidazol reductase NimA-like FMN-containing flavoprotein (pyridoxamine 5'-phosphate oxidase superfamily)